MLNFNISTFKVQNDHIFLNILNFNLYHWLQLTWKLKQVESDFRLKFHSPTRLNQILVWILIPPRLNLTGARLMHKHKAGAATDVTGWAEHQPHIWYMIYDISCLLVIFAPKITKMPNCSIFFNGSQIFQVWDPRSCCKPSFQPEGGRWHGAAD